MTLPYERYRTLINTRNFLESLLDPKKTPKVPKTIRRDALLLLKHYPKDLDLEITAEQAPNIFSVKRS